MFFRVFPGSRCRYPHYWSVSLCQTAPPLSPSCGKAASLHSYMDKWREARDGSDGSDVYSSCTPLQRCLSPCRLDGMMAILPREPDCFVGLSVCRLVLIGCRRFVGALDSLLLLDVVKNAKSSQTDDFYYYRRCPSLGLQVFRVFGFQCHGSESVGGGFRVQGSGFRVQGSGFRVQGSGFRVQGSGFRVWYRAS